MIIRKITMTVIDSFEEQIMVLGKRTQNSQF